jgi:hypothetical protein
MKTLLITLLTIVLTSATACQSKKETILKPANQEITEAAAEEIPYVVAHNYFVKNTVESIENPKIETEEAFNSYFGMAATMSENGKPTAIDFTKEYVIAVVLPKSDIATTIKPISLIKETDNGILFKYQIESGNKQSFISKPVLLLIVNKKYDGNVSLKQLN